MLCIIERYMDIKLLNKYIAGDVLPEEKKEVIIIKYILQSMM